MACIHTTIINYASSIVNKLEALFTDDARVVIYYRHVFIVQATEWEHFSADSYTQSSNTKQGTLYQNDI